MSSSLSNESNETVSVLNGSGTRYHGLDALRGSAMLLGIVIHGCIAYMPQMVLFWPVMDQHTSPLATLLIVCIHAFRLQTFFLLSGFFTALLIDRRGRHVTTVQRTKRLVIPFIVSIVTFMPLVRIAGLWAVQLMPPGVHREGVVAFYGNSEATGSMLDRIFSLDLYRHQSIAHIWFLEYLIIISAIFLIAAPWFDRWLVSSGVQRVCAFVLKSPIRPVWFAIVTVFAMLSMDSWNADTPLNSIPDVGVLAYYAWFFGVGWMMYRNIHLIAEYTRNAAAYFAVATLVVIPAMIVCYSSGRPDDIIINVAYWIPCLIVYALYTWLMIFTLLGFFMKWMNKPKPWVRYLSDSAYWVYLIHLPVVMYFQVIVVDWPIHAMLKLVLVVFGTSVVCLVTYHLMVRRTIIGTMLNGRR